jgi:parvulin-like peptidyl-prolyl isomerase
LAKKNVEQKPREYTKRQVSHAKRQQLRQRIYLFGGITVIAAVILLTMAGWLFGEFLPMNKVIVSVYDTKITEKDMIDTMVIYGTAQSGLDIAQNMDYILQAMIQNILVERTAKDLGITVSDQEVKDAVQGGKLSNARKTIVRGSLLTEKLRKEYFSKQVSDSGNQVLMNAMMVESEELVPGIRSRLLNGEAFTALAEEYALNVVSKTNKGVFDWHPQTVLSRDISTSIPVDWAFKEDVKKGDISEALADNTSSKQLGYWLIKLNQRLQTADKGPSANVSAILLSSRAEALSIKAQLAAGESLSSLADKFSQYSPSQQGGGEFVAAQSENVSTNFNTYVFGTDTLTGEWSNPIKDDRYYTKGGAWVVQVVDKANDHPYSEDDKSTLIDSAYSDWVSKLWLGSTTDIAYTFDDAGRSLAIQRATKQIANSSLSN